jgi:N-acetylglucosaminyldiphosphoundecaprenol N-acetyl-beta-D-mannosaminyltransferase
MAVPDRQARDRVALGEAMIDNVTMGEAVRLVEDHIERGERLLVTTPNVDHLFRLQRDAEFRRAYTCAGLVLADGVPLLWLARLQGTPLKAKVSGSDFLLEVCRAAASTGRRVFLLGSAEGVAQAAAERLTARFPDLEVAGAHTPSWGFEGKPDESRQIVDLLKQSRPNILFVGVGAPKQEKWVLRYWDELDPMVYVGVGAAFDFISGRRRRAPAWIQNAGLEWFWRLAQEPRRLFYRYLIEDFPFFFGLFLRTFGRRLKGIDS